MGRPQKGLMREGTEASQGCFMPEYSGSQVVRGECMKKELVNSIVCCLRLEEMRDMMTRDVDGDGAALCQSDLACLFHVWPLKI